MTTTDTDALTKRLCDRLIEQFAHQEPRPEFTTVKAVKIAGLVAPIVAVEVRKAKAEALREAVRDMGEWADEALVVTGDEHDESTWLEWTVGEWLEHRAVEHETGDSDEHR